MRSAKDTTPTTDPAAQGTPPPKPQPAARPKSRRAADSFLRELQQNFSQVDASLHRAFAALHRPRPASVPGEQSLRKAVSAPATPALARSPGMAKVLQQAEEALYEVQRRQQGPGELAEQALAIIRRASTDPQADALEVATDLVQAVVSHVPSAPKAAPPAADEKPQEPHPRPLGSNPVYPMPVSRR